MYRPRTDEEASFPPVKSSADTLYNSPHATRPSSPSKVDKPEPKRVPMPWSETEWTLYWTWDLFAANLGTGAVYLTVSSVPYKFRGQHAIGSVFLILNFVLMAFNIAMQALRLYKHPKAFRAAFYQDEAIWFPAATLSVASLLMGVVSFGIPFCGPWLIWTVYVWFWVYTVMSAASGLISELTIRSIPRDLSKVGGSECLDVFPLMLIGSLGGLLAPSLGELDASRALTVIVFSYIMQGLGFFMGFMKLTVWMNRHIQLGRPETKILLTYVIAGGPPGFTALALINLGLAALDVFPKSGFMAGFDDGGISPTLVAQVFLTAGVWFALMLMGICSWVFMQQASIIFFAAREMYREGGYLQKFQLSWWANTFPVAGFIVTCGRLGEYCPSKAFAYINIIMTFFIFFMWLNNMIGTLTLFWNGILPGAPLEGRKKE